MIESAASAASLGVAGERCASSRLDHGVPIPSGEAALAADWISKFFSKGVVVEKWFLTCHPKSSPRGSIIAAGAQSKVNFGSNMDSFKPDLETNGFFQSL